MRGWRSADVTPAPQSPRRGRLLRWPWGHLERGSQAVEFALIAPIFLYLVLCVPVFGLAIRSWLVITMAARDAAREYSVLARSDITVATNTAFLRAHQTMFGQGLPVMSNDMPQCAWGVSMGSGRCAVDIQRVEEDHPGEPKAPYVIVTVRYRQPAILPGLGRLLVSSAQATDDFLLEAPAKFRVER